MYGLWGKSVNLHFIDTKAQRTYPEGLCESDLQSFSLARPFQDAYWTFVHVTVKKEQKAYEAGLVSPKITFLHTAGCCLGFYVTIVGYVVVNQ